MDNYRSIEDRDTLLDLAQRAPVSAKDGRVLPSQIDLYVYLYIYIYILV